MGSAAAVVVEVSSDDEDGWRTPGGKRKSTDGGWRTPGAGKQPPDGGWRTPGAGKQPPDGGWRTPGAGKDNKSPDSGLEWAEKLLGEDYDEIGDGLDDSAAMQELLKSLMDETNIVVEGKKSSVDEPEEKNSLPDADVDDDDDCVILDGDPEQAIVVAKEEEPRRDAAEDELQIVAEKGELACRDFPHPRHLCASLAFNTSSHASHCSMCHCYVCDSPAPCAFWGKGTGINDHCHATDKDAKWKRLRQSSKRQSQQMPKGGGIQNLLQSTSTTSADVMIPSTGRFPVSRTVSQNQQVHPSIMVSQNTGQPRAPSSMRRTTTPSNRLKRARPAPPVYTPSNGNYLQPPVSNNSPTQSALSRGFQTAQIPPENTFWNCPSLRPPTAPTAPPSLSVPKGSQGYHRQPIPYPQAPPNTVVGTGVPLSRCTSMSIQGKRHSQGPAADAMRMSDALTYLAHQLGVPDYNIEPPVGQQSASTPQTLRPNQLLAQAMASQGGEVNQNYIAGRGPLILRIPRHNSSNHTSGSIALSSGAVQTKQPLCQLNSESSLDQNEPAPSTVVRSLPWNLDGK